MSNGNNRDGYFYDFKIDSEKKYQYVTAGERCKTIGWQDGNFYDFGHHIPDEMGGVWVHPIKIADGFWLGVNGEFNKADGYRTLPYGNAFLYAYGDVECERFQYSPDNACGVVINYTFASDTPKTLELEFVVNFHIMPVWFSEPVGKVDFAEEAMFENGCVVAKDMGNEWYGLLGCSEGISEDRVVISKQQLSPHSTSGNGISVKLSITLELNGKADLSFYIAGSFTNKDQLWSEYNKLRDRSLLDVKINRYQRIKERTDLETSDPVFDNIFTWVKYNTDWLVADCGSYGRGLTAGCPEYPWWFGCDNAYSIQGLLAMGEFELARDTLVLLKDYSEKTNGNGRVVHEITNFGGIPNPGNTQETGHYITAVYHYWHWSGDTETMKTLFSFCEKGVQWLLTEMDPDGDLLPHGYGIMEVKGLNVELIDTAVYTCQALYCMSEMAGALGMDADTYRAKAEMLKAAINDRLWIAEEGLYADAIGTVQQISGYIDAFLIEEGDMVSPDYSTYLRNLKAKYDRMPQEDEVAFLTNKNWVILTPMETMLSDHGKAIQALDNMYNDEYIGEYGTYLSGFSQSSIMTISTGVHAVAEGRHKRCDHALALLKRMCNSFSCVLPNSISEMSPDYGCFTQAWTAYAMLVPVVECFAGIKPRLQDNSVVIEPQIPSEWERMALKNIRVGEMVLDFTYENGYYMINLPEDCAYTVTFNISDRVYPLGGGLNTIPV